MFGMTSSEYDENDIFNAEETTLNQTLKFNVKKYDGQLSKDRIPFLMCANINGTE